MQFVLDSDKRRYIRADGDAVRTVKVLAGDAAYYGGPEVSPTSNDGSLTSGSDETFSVSKWFLSSGSSLINVKDETSTEDIDIAVTHEAPLNPQWAEYGAVGDDVANDTAALQAVLDAAADNAEIYLPPGRYSTTAISQTGKTLHIRGPGTLVERTAQTVPLLKLTDADSSTVEGITVEGLEDADSYDGLDSDRDGIRFDDVTGGRIVDVTVTGKSYGIRLLDCLRTKVVRPTVTGFGASGISGANFHSGVRVRSSLACEVLNVDVKSCGSGVLNDSSSTRTNILGGNIEDCYDNAVYVSSGNACKVSGVNVLGPTDQTGAGIKVRGNVHSVIGNTVRQVSIGIYATGNGTDVDALGANGYGTVISGNVVDDTTGQGIAVNSQDGFFPRHFRVEGNTVTNTVQSAGAEGGINVVGHGMAVKDNTVDTCGSTTAMVIVAGVISDTWVDMLTGCDVSGNVFYAPTQDCIRLGRMTKSTIALNRSASTNTTPDLIDARTVTDSDLIGNVARSMGRVVRLDSGCTGNRVIDNDGGLTSADSNHVDHVRSGTPESVIAGSVGSVIRNPSGGYGNATYFKANGNSTTGWVPVRGGGQQTISTDAAFTLTPSTSPTHTIHTGTLTADRAVTLSTTGAEKGMMFRITRSGAGAFNLNVGTGPLKALATGTWAEFSYDGSAWLLSAYGAL